MDALFSLFLALFGPFLICGAGVLIWGRKGAWIVLVSVALILFGANYWLQGAQSLSLGSLPFENAFGLVLAVSYFVLSAYLAGRYVR